MPRKTTDKPTIKQRKLARLLATDNTLTVKEASVKAGYSMNTNTYPITASPTFQQLLDKYLPDKALLRTNKQALKATKPFINNKGQEKNIPDWSSRLKATEIGFKLKGKYIESATQVNIDGIKIEVTEALNQGSEDKNS